MCILFVFTSVDGSADGYRLILASNRDEDFSRPARQADFWENQPNIISGLDMTVGKEGGTWLGASASGKVGVLLNYPFAPADPGKKGRGFLVNDYLTTTQSTSEFLTRLADHSDDYNPFHLVTIDLVDPNCVLRHFCNVDARITHLANGQCHAFCNSSLDRPYVKATAGLGLFKEVVNTAEEHENMAARLFKFLQNEDKFYPDSVLDTLPMNQPANRQDLASIFVNPVEGTYGTRTSTVILVSNSGNIHFYERTLKLPIENGKRQWLNSYKQFKM